MDADGGNIEPITFTLIFDNEPKVTADGRIAFIRTDNFLDRAKVETQIHVVHPDGSGGATEIGANVGAVYGTRLRRYGYGSPAPLPDGRLACISNRGNFICTPGTLEPSYQKLPGGLGDLAPLPDGRLLATILRPEGRGMQSDVLAVLDPKSNDLIAVHTSKVGSVHSPVSLEPRPRPPIRSDVADRTQSGRPGATGYLYCQNARFTRKSKADWDQIRAVRVLGAKGLTTRSSHSHIVHAGHETIELVATCLALLGDPEANAVDDLKAGVSATHGAWAGKPAPDNRAAQVLSFMCRDKRHEPAVRAAYERYRAKPDDAVKRPMGNPKWIPQRHWVLFYLGRTLGNLGDARSVDSLAASLRPELNEARYGRPDPAEPNIHFLQLEYTPCWRAAAAWALGQIGDARVAPLLLDVVKNMDNAIDTRHCAAEALGLIADPASLPAIRKLAAGYPEVSTRRELLAACGD